MSFFRLTSLLLCSTAIISTSAHADPSLEELKARLERAKKENILLKTEQLERENVAIRLKKIEAENAALRNELKADKLPSAGSGQTSIVASTVAANDKGVAKRGFSGASIRTAQEKVATLGDINRELNNIPKDDARREMTAAYKVPREELPIVVKQWQGVYAGINVGYSTGDINSTSSQWSLATGSQPSYGVLRYVTNYNGPATGGQLGYNYQLLSNFIFGGELDFQYADIRNTATGGSNQTYSYSLSQGAVNTSSQTNRTGLNWYGTVRARMGYVLGNFMPYATVGFAYGSLSQNALSASSSYFNYGNSINSYTNISGYGLSGADANVSVGWTAGAGSEYKVAENWSVKGEYLYTSLNGLNGITSYLGQSILAGVGYPSSQYSSGGWTNTTTGPFGFHQARVGLNYHTDWLSFKPAVAAK